MGFSFVRILVSLELTGNVPDPYALFRLTRSGWQNAFRSALKCNSICCDSCTMFDCPGYQAFSQSLASDPSALRRFQKPSPPFIFSIPVLPHLPNRNITCFFCLTLVGSAVNHTFHYMESLRLLFTTGVVPLKILNLETGGYGAQRYPFLPNGSMVVLSDEGVLQSRVLSPDRVSMEFVSPLRLVADGKSVRLLPPSLILRSLMRRVSALAYYYGGIEVEVDFKWLSRLSSLVRTMEYSLRWEDHGRFPSGLLGGITLVGDLADFHYFLAMGEYLNVGKGASYGLGNYILRE